MIQIAVPTGERASAEVQDLLSSASPSTTSLGKKKSLPGGAETMTPGMRMNSSGASSFMGVASARHKRDKSGGRKTGSGLSTATPDEIKARLQANGLSFYNRDPTHAEFEEVRLASIRACVQL